MTMYTLKMDVVVDFIEHPIPEAWYRRQTRELVDPGKLGRQFGHDSRYQTRPHLDALQSCCCSSETNLNEGFMNKND